MNKDVTVIYQGASGGFLLFYYLLLSGGYRTGIRNNYTATELIDQQFPATLQNDRTNWKLHEFWPDNVWAKQNQTGPRLFLICNPFFNPVVNESNQWVANDTYKILLYTDLKLQTRLAWEKQAWWFTAVSRQQYQQGTNSEYLRWILSQGKYDPPIKQIQSVYQPDLTVRLEEFVSNPSLPGFNHPNNAQQDFVRYWVSLQSTKSQQLLSRLLTSS